jgi:hypothetical protein
MRAQARTHTHTPVTLTGYYINKHCTPETKMLYIFDLQGHSCITFITPTQK